MSLRTIKERADAATPGPWKNRYEYAIEAPAYDVLAMVDKADALMTSTDATFIAHARTDIPALLAVAEAARSLVEQEGDCDPMGLGCRHIPCPWPDLRAALADLEALP